jgi:hypothetical protein
MDCASYDQLCALCSEQFHLSNAPEDYGAIGSETVAPDLGGNEVAVNVDKEGAYLVVSESDLSWIVGLCLEELQLAYRPECKLHPRLTLAHIT